MSDQETSEQKTDGPLIKELQGIVNKHSSMIKLLPKFGRDILTEILQFVGKLVRDHEILRDRVDAMEKKARE